MIKNKFSIALLAVTVLIFASCEKENEIDEIMVTEPASLESKHFSTTADKEIFNPDFEVDPVTYSGHNLRNDLLKSDAVEPSECAPTEFDQVMNEVIEPFYSDVLALTYYSLYLDLNFYISYFDTSKQYFGDEGQYTNFVKKRVRELEKFWNMPNQIRVNGQHTASLNDREKLADIYMIVGANVETREDAYAIADQLLEINEASPVLPESPYFAMDGFATSANLIVIGDGITSVLSRTGIDEDIVWTGILAHEWAHQVQFDNYAEWYPNGAADNEPEATRYTELEADFFAAYYMTHKRGATYNWKRVEQFMELFAQIGDCSFTSNGHHGTPIQRLNASRLGYDLANGAHKQGHIMNEQELHEYFVANVQDLL